jgi:hypothetical protein
MRSKFCTEIDCPLGALLPSDRCVPGWLCIRPDAAQPPNERLSIGILLARLHQVSPHSLIDTGLFFTIAIGFLVVASFLVAHHLDVSTEPSSLAQASVDTISVPKQRSRSSYSSEVAVALCRTVRSSETGYSASISRTACILPVSASNLSNLYFLSLLTRREQHLQRTAYLAQTCWP